MTSLQFTFGWNAFMIGSAILAFGIIGYIQFSKFLYKKKSVSPKFSMMHYLVGVSCALGLVLMAFNVEAYERIEFSECITCGDMPFDEVLLNPRTWQEERKFIPPPPEPEEKIELPVIKPVINPVLVTVDLDPVESEDVQPITTEAPAYNLDSMMLATKNNAPVIVATEEDDDPVIFADFMPVFPGCNEDGMTSEERRLCTESHLMKYIHKNLKYPALERDIGIEGTVVVQFVVDKSGKLTDIKAMRAISPGLGNAAESVLKKMGDNLDLWTPGSTGGRKVKVRYHVPIKFRLE